MEDVRVLLVGLGGFGRNHLRAWNEMGMGERLYVAELNEELHAETRLFNIPQERLTIDYTQFLDEVDIVDIVTPSTSHFDLVNAAIDAGKDVFVEKPMTMNSAEAKTLAERISDSGRMLQIGYYYRFHPMSPTLKRAITDGTMGDPRYVSGNFMGFKRPRMDVGVTHTDGIHFLDLFNWLLGTPPSQVFAITRDHFDRGLEDMSVVLMEYPDGTVGKVESGYIQPGNWRDKVVPNAVTSKELFFCGSKATAEVNFETEYMQIHDVHHEFVNGMWAPITSGTNTLNTGTATPVQMIMEELKDFLHCVETRRRPSADVIGSGVVLGRLMEAIYESAAKRMPVSLTWSEDEIGALRDAPVSGGN